MKHLSLLALTALMLSACASKPILLPNEKYNRVGHERSEKDVDMCMRAADNQLKKTQGRRILRSAVTGAVVGGAIGGISGSRGSTGAIGGAVGGAAIGGGAGALMGAASTPEEAKRNIVSYCLRRKGYDVAGWD